MKKLLTEGMTVVEIVISVAVIIIVVVAFASAWQVYLKISNINAQYTQAALLTEEAEEILNIMRDQSWDAKIAVLNLNTPYYLYWTGSTYAATTTVTNASSLVGRKIVFNSVLRNAVTKNIASSGVADTDTRRVTITVYPLTASTTPISQVDMLIHNVYDN